MTAADPSSETSTALAGSGVALRQAQSDNDRVRLLPVWCIGHSPPSACEQVHSSPIEGRELSWQKIAGEAVIVTAWSTSQLPTNHETRRLSQDMFVSELSRSPQR
jgi:hypothetical protein